MSMFALCIRTWLYNNMVKYKTFREMNWITKIPIKFKYRTRIKK